MIKKFITLLIATISIQLAINGQVKLPKIISNNMLLQRDVPVPIWGWAAPGEIVSVKFANQQQTVTTDAKGYWKIMLAPMMANARPQNLTIVASNTITLTNILIGEVWLCGGQSNMEYTMRLNKSFAKPKVGIDSTLLVLDKSFANIRLFKVEKVISSPDVTSTGWQECSGEALAGFSAAGFYFAKKLQQALDVPIGVISSSWGGTRIEPWTPAEAYQELPAFADASLTKPYMIDSVQPGKNFTAMIQPLAPYALRGFLWYQGESNCMINDGLRYADKTQALINSWRKAFGSKELPFYAVQISPYYYSKRKDKVPHSTEELARFWEAQYLATKIPNTAIIATTDLVDNLADIHPSYKWKVGERLAALALAKTYNRNTNYSGPVYDKMRIKGNKIVIEFKHATGLTTTDAKPVQWFMIAGKDNQFVAADARIDGHKIIVSSPQVTAPKAVRFAWDESAMPNLVNSAGLPAYPFRTNPATWKYNSIK